MTEQHSHTRGTEAQHSEHSGAENHGYRSQDQIHQQLPGEAPQLSPFISLTSNPSLLGNPALKGRGNAPTRIALMRQMQKTYGNRATRILLQRIATTATDTGKGTDSTSGTSTSISDTLSDDAHLGLAGTSLVIQRMKASEVQVDQWYTFTDYDSNKTQRGKLVSKGSGWYKFKTDSGTGRAHGAANIRKRIHKRERDDTTHSDSNPSKKPKKGSQLTPAGRLNEAAQENVVNETASEDIHGGDIQLGGRLAENVDKEVAHLKGAKAYVDLNEVKMNFPGMDSLKVTPSGKLEADQSKFNDQEGGKDDNKAARAYANNVKHAPDDTRKMATKCTETDPNTGKTYGQLAVEPLEKHVKGGTGELGKQQPNRKRVQEELFNKAKYPVPNNLLPKVENNLGEMVASVGNSAKRLRDMVVDKGVNQEELQKMREAAKKKKEKKNG